MHMILADADVHYSEMLAAGLQQAFPGVQIRRCGDHQTLRRLITDPEILAGPAVFLYHPGEFQELIHLPAAEVWPAGWQTLPLVSDPHAGTPGLPYPEASTSVLPAAIRYGSLNALVRQLRSTLDPPEARTAEQVAGQTVSETSSLAARSSTPKQTSATRIEADASISAISDDADQQAVLIMNCTVTPNGFQPAYTLNLLRRFRKQGRRVVYLPLMPAYQMVCLSPPDSGPNLSDLLLLLSGAGVPEIDLGHYWQPNPEGYLQFRAPDRSDDLLLCSADTLRRLAMMLRERLTVSRRTDEPTSALLDCSGLPFVTLSVLAAVCDLFEIGLPRGDSFAANAARVEASRLLAALPTGCLIRERLI